MDAAPEGVFPRKIDQLRPRIDEFSEEQLRKLQDKYIADPKDKPTIWTKLTLVSLSCDPHIRCFDFIPRDPSQGHIVHISRIENEEETSCQEIYEYHMGSLRFYLPVKSYSPEKVFSLSTRLISDTIQGLSIDRALVSTALNSLIRDRTMEGIALTISEGTFIWLKGPSPILEQENTISQ